MKKIFSLIIAGVALLSAASCVHEQLAVFDPAKGTAPVLGTTTVDDKGVTAEFTPGSFDMGFNKSIPVNHSLAIVELDGAKISKTLSANASDGKISISKANLSKALIALGKPEGSTVSLKMAVRASMQNPAQDNGVNGYIDSKDLIDIPSWLVEIPEVQGNPWKDFATKSTWSVIGSIASTGNEWNKDEPMFSSPDGTQHVATRLKLAASDQFKVRNNGGWDDNRGAGGDVEPFVLALGEAIPAVGGGKNLAVPADGVYDLLYDSAAETITLTEAFMTYPGFDQASPWSVIGAIASFEMEWNKDIAMTTDGTWHVAEGVELKASDQFKFRKDQDWTDNFGAEGDVEPFVVTLDNEYPAAGGGKNLAVPADGVYDLLVNPDAKLFKVVESLGGKSGLVGSDEPGPGPEPEPVTGWNVIGLNGDWDNDVRATESNGVWTAFIQANDATEFKWRKDGGWDENYGGVMAAFDQPFEAVAGGDNIKLPEAGLFKAVLDLSDASKPMLAVYKNFEVWSLIGVNGDWEKDIDMTLTDGKWVSPAVRMKGEFKLRKNHDWGENRGGAMEAIGQAFKVENNGPNINIADEAEYIVTYDPAAETVVVDKSISGWNVIGLNGDWSNDVIAAENNGVWSVRVTVEAATEFKWRKDGDWAENYGGTFVALGEPFEAVNGGPNIPLQPGFWLLTLDLSGATPMLMVSNGDVWSLIGVAGDWNNDIDMTLTDGKWVSPAVKFSGEFKLRKNHDWGENRGGNMEALGQPFKVENNGPNIKVENEAEYIVTYDPAAETVTVAVATYGWSLIGVGGDWNNDIDMSEKDGKWVSPAVKFKGEFKLRYEHDWAVNRGGVFAALGEPFKVENNGPNINLPDENTYVVTYNPADETVTVTAAGGSGGGAAIKSADELIAWLASPKTDAELGADIDLTGKSFVPDTLKGTFDGKGYKVTYSMEVPVDATYNGGLFSCVDGTVKNLKTAGSLKFIATEEVGTINLGGVAGVAAENAVLENCENSVNIFSEGYGSAVSHFGGIVAVAKAGAKISSCTNKGNVEFIQSDVALKGRAQQLGGIAGQVNETGTVEKCTNEGRIKYVATGTCRVGGIIGYVNNVDGFVIKDCVNKGEALTEYVWPGSGYSYIGGITGYFGTPKGAVTFEGCVNDGKVGSTSDEAGCSRVGGIAAYGGNSSNGANSNEMLFKNCVNNGEIFATGTTANKNPVGGIVGMGEASAKFILEGCTMNGKATTASNYAGGLIGQKGGTASSITDCVVTDQAVITIATGTGIGLFAGQNAKYTTAITGKVQGGTIVIGTESTAITADNYAGHIVGAALGNGGSTDGVTFGN